MRTRRLPRRLQLQRLRLLRQAAANPDALRAALRGRHIRFHSYGLRAVLTDVADGLLPKEALMCPARTARRLIQVWKSGGLLIAEPPAYAHGRRAPAARADIWMHNRRVVMAYCRLARTLAPNYAPDLSRLLAHLHTERRPTWHRRWRR